MEVTGIFVSWRAIKRIATTWPRWTIHSCRIPRTKCVSPRTRISRNTASAAYAMANRSMPTSIFTWWGSGSTCSSCRWIPTARMSAIASIATTWRPRRILRRWRIFLRRLLPMSWRPASSCAARAISSKRSRKLSKTSAPFAIPMIAAFCCATMKNAVAPFWLNLSVKAQACTRWVAILKASTLSWRPGRILWRAVRASFWKMNATWTNCVSRILFGVLRLIMRVWNRSSCSRSVTAGNCSATCGHLISISKMYWR